VKPADDAFQERVLGILQDLVRIDTTNPPGNEMACVDYLVQLLQRAGVETRVMEPSPGRGNLIARVRGSGARRPLMLMGHLDVVAAVESGWKHPPFAGVLEDGYLWGRGTTDNKHMVAIAATILMALAEGQVRLSRDVLLAATADEEHGGRWGMAWLAEHDPEIRTVDCALNEGGGEALRVRDHLFYTCQTAEKGICRTVWQAHSAGGHASRPRTDMSTLALARALARLGDGHMGGRVIETMRRALEDIAATTSDDCAVRVQWLLDQGAIEQALQEAGFSQEEAARTRTLFYDTTSPTVLRAGDAEHLNVIPAISEALLDGRILPGQTARGYMAQLQALAGDEVTVTLHDHDYTPGLESSPSSPIMDVIAAVIAEQSPGATVIPWQCAGSTDAKHLIPRGVPVYGFVPALPPRGDQMDGGAHAVNERISLESLYFGYRVLYDIVTRYCAVE